MPWLVYVPQLRSLAKDDACGRDCAVFGMAVCSFLGFCGNSTVLSASYDENSGGKHYALLTLRQMAEMERGIPGAARYLLPCGEIEDSPVCAFRGIHFCILPESDPNRIETMIRMAAYCKFNYIVWEAWGVFPFSSHPEVGREEYKWTREAFEHLLLVAKDCNIALIPQLNLSGHAAFSRVGSAKHAVLDFHPERETLYEPGGWSYCLSNMETRKILTDLALELYEFFGKPPFFHIGCDESYDFQTCAVCAAANPETLLLNHLLYFRGLFAGHGCRIIMWHDMLLMADDPRWAGCIAFGDARTRGVLSKLPADIIIADWQYGKAPENSPDHEWPTANYLHDSGYDVLLCPWMEEAGIFQAGAQVEKRKLFGLLETTWNAAYQKDFVKMFTAASAAAWRGKVEPIRFDDAVHVAFARNLRHIHQDMGITRYRIPGIPTIRSLCRISKTVYFLSRKRVSFLMKEKMKIDAEVK
ncbi:MAG: family 20 glycosylhydrolase [Lentisphaeria bacterium]|nr:family 20 glycosylhydrolase [Lentisphaeria bacterium]